MTQAALDHLITSHAAFGPLIGRIGPPRPEIVRREPFEALIRSIAHQQLHGNAARAILARFAALFPQSAFPTPQLIAAVDDPALRACGFSATKIAAIRDICAKRLDGTVPTAKQAATLDDATLIERLVTIRGVGRWTVEMVLISALGRPGRAAGRRFRRARGLAGDQRAGCAAAAQGAGGDRRGLGALPLHRGVVPLARVRRDEEDQAVDIVHSPSQAARK